MGRSQTARAALTKEAALAEIRALLARDDLRGARARSEELARLHPEWQEVRDAAIVLAPPRAWSTGKATGRDRSQEMEWLREHGEEYTGNWVALRGAKLLGADPDRVQLRNDLVERGELEGSLFAFLPNDPLCHGA